MAANAWLASYLDAYVDATFSVEDYGHKALDRDADAGAKYFVNEILAKHEDDLKRTWSKLTASNNEEVKDSRLEYLTWRIWFMKRLQRQMEREEADTRKQRRALKAQAQQDVNAEATEDEVFQKTAPAGEPPETSPAAGASPTDANASRDLAEWLPQAGPEPGAGLYIVMISMHGLVRGDRMELGKDADTGGQVKYVVELAKALAKQPAIRRVDLLTRLIKDPKVDASYGEPVETLLAGDKQGEGAYIIRVPCGPTEDYLHKEALWPYMPEFADNALMHILQVGKEMSSPNGQPLRPFVIHGHYADAGEAASILAGFFGVPMVATGHSLGRNKLQQLLSGGRMTKEAADQTYNIMRRIAAEETILDNAEVVFVSTSEEIEKQWGLYDGYNAGVAQALHARQQRMHSHFVTRGRFMPHMQVIPPGMDFSTVHAPEFAPDGSAVFPPPEEEPEIWKEISRFLRIPRKPAILALCRPDPKKNVTTLVRAFAETPNLRHIANLVLVLGNRDNIDAMAKGSANELTTILKLIDAYDLYGHVAYPKHHASHEVRDIYSYAAITKGVFVNPALQEPFGLTLIEAAAHGVPVVATKYGGPNDILDTLHNGFLVDPFDHKSIGDAMLRLVSDRVEWESCRNNGLQNIGLYSWEEHCNHYLATVNACRQMQLSTPNWGFSNSINTLMTASLTGSLENFDLQLEKDGAKEAASGGLKRTASDSGSRGMFIAAAAALALQNCSKIVVIAMDSVKGAGEPGEFDAMTKALKAALSARKDASSVAFGIATAARLKEVEAALGAAGISAADVAFVIASSGAEVYFTNAIGSLGSHFGRENDDDSKFVLDTEFAEHLDFRWDRAAIKHAMDKFTQRGNRGMKNGSVGSSMSVMAVQDEHADTHSLQYRVVSQDQAKATPWADDVQQWLRARGYRCRLLYTRGNTSLSILPLRASRAQAIRYIASAATLPLIEVLIATAFEGDADQAELLAGVPRIVVVPDATATPAGPAQKTMEFALQAGAHAVESSKGPEGIVDGLKHFGFL
eukprot:jgi/Chlat1/4049/Chrsp26S04101